MPIGHLRSVIGRLRAFRWRYVVVGYHNRTAKILYPIVSCPSTDTAFSISRRNFSLSSYPLIVIDVAAQNNSQILQDDESFPDPEATNQCVDTRDIKCTEREREKEREGERRKGKKRKRKGRRRKRKKRGWKWGRRNESTKRGGGSVEVARKDCLREKRAGSRPGAGLLSLTEVPNTCGITGAGQVHRWRRKTKVFSTREPQDGILLQAAFLQRLLRNWFTWKIVYWTNLVLSLLFRILLSLRIYDRNHLLRNLEFLKLSKVI